MKLKPVVIFLASIIFLSGCSKESNIKKIKIGHGLDQTHPVHLAMEFLAERVAEKSSGKIQITVYPSQQLGTERECLELLQIGSLGMTKVSSSVLEGFVPIYKVFSLPFVFDNEEHKFKVFESELGRKLLQSTEKYWLRGLCFYDAGSRSFYTKVNPVLSPSDLRGLKIRTQESATSVKMVLLLLSHGENYIQLYSRELWMVQKTILPAFIHRDIMKFANIILWMSTPLFRMYFL